MEQLVCVLCSNLVLFYIDRVLYFNDEKAFLSFSLYGFISYYIGVFNLFFLILFYIDIINYDMYWRKIFCWVYSCTCSKRWHKKKLVSKSKRHHVTVLEMIYTQNKKVTWKMFSIVEYPTLFATKKSLGRYVLKSLYSQKNKEQIYHSQLFVPCSSSCYAIYFRYNFLTPFSNKRQFSEVMWKAEMYLSMEKQTF